MNWFHNSFDNLPERRELPKLDVSTVINSKKLAELKNWMIKQSSGNTIRFLFLTGPSGSGKKTTVRQIAESQKISLCEWNSFMAESPQVAEFDTFRCSEIAEFLKFVYQSDRYCSVLRSDSRKSRIILVRDLPTIFSTKSNVFSQFLREFSDQGRCSMIFLEEDQQILRKNVNLIEDLPIDTIEFRPMSKTAIKSILSTHVGTEFAKMVADKVHGDGNSARNLAQTSRRALAQFGGTGVDPRAQTLSFFHILGKILYGKRDQVGQLTENSEDLVTRVDGEKLFLFLHQNCLDFCAEDSLVSLMESLSVCDRLGGCQEFEEFGGYALLAGKSVINLSKRRENLVCFRPITRPFYYSFVREIGIWREIEWH